jgi:hypothetical protein
MLEPPLQPKCIQKGWSENFRGGIIFSFEFHRKQIVAILGVRQAF